MPRKPMTKARRNRIKKRDGEGCAIPDCPNMGEHVDHHIPLWLQPWSKLDLEADENLRLICQPCHTRKTRAEAAARAKSKRLENERNGKPKTKAKANKKEIKSRGFDKNWKRRINKPTERRVT